MLQFKIIELEWKKLKQQSKDKQKRHFVLTLMLDKLLHNSFMQLSLVIKAGLDNTVNSSNNWIHRWNGI